MKNYLIALVITAAMTASASTVQQMHRHTPRTTITDDGQTTDNNRKTAKKNTSEGNTDAATVKQGTTDTHDFTVKKSTKHSAKAKNSSRTTLTTDTDNTDGNNDGIEAYSDTSSTNFDSIYGQHQYSYQVNMDEDSLNHIITIFSDNIGNRLHKTEFDDFCREYPNVTISLHTSGGIFHDRYIVIDYNTADEQIYHCGASSKDGGNKVTTITAVTDGGIYHPVIDRLIQNPALTLK